MNCNIIEKNNRKYIKCSSNGDKIMSEKDVLALVAACFETRVNFLIVHDDALADEFFTLSTGLAGAMLQKLINYNIKTAIVADDRRFNLRFGEMALETNKRNDFRVYNTLEAAEEWILNI